MARILKRHAERASCPAATKKPKIQAQITAIVFTALHGMHTRSCDEISVCPSVCLSVRLSVKRVHCDKTEEKSVQIFIPCER